jgi:hypothetical protein
MEGYSGAHRGSIESPSSGCRSSLPTLSEGCDGLCLAVLLSQHRASLLRHGRLGFARGDALASFLLSLLINIPALSVLAR